MIEISDVTKRYGSTVAADRLSLEGREGEVTGFLGPDGAGKSTTMGMMVGLDAPTSGQATIDGHRYADLRFPLRHVGAPLEARAIHPGRGARNHPRGLAASNDSDRRGVDHDLTLYELSPATRPSTSSPRTRPEPGVQGGDPGRVDQDALGPLDDMDPARRRRPECRVRVVVGGHPRRLCASCRRHPRRPPPL
jgi:ABC-2 type transport system ATP-binding protein